MGERIKYHRTIGEVVGTGSEWGRRRDAADTAAWLAIQGFDSHGGYGIGFGQDFAHEMGAPEAIAQDRRRRIDPVYGGSAEGVPQAT